MANDRERVFVPDPPPAGTDPVLAEWLIRQLEQLNNTTTSTNTVIVEQGEGIEDVTDGLELHVNNVANPHQVAHTQLIDYATAPVDNPHGMMRWVNGYISGDSVKKHDVVLAGAWTRSANKDTDDIAEPTAQGNESYVYQGTSPPASTVAKEIIASQIYTFSESRFVNGWRANTKAGQTYRAYLVQDPNGAAIVNPLQTWVASTDGWIEFSVSPAIAGVGVQFQLALVMQEPSPTPATWTASYLYSTPNNPAIPAAGECSQSTKLLDSLRFNKHDYVGTDRGAELGALSPGDIIVGPGGLRWSIQVTTDNTTWMDFTVAPAQQDTGTGVQTFTFETVTATAISYIEDVGYFASDPAVTGQIRIDGGAPVSTQNAYNIDLLTQGVYDSPDWDTVAPAA